MNEIIPVKPSIKRQRYSPAFKARILAACEQPDISVAGVALANGLNANLIHKWRRLVKAQPSEQPEPADFLPIPMMTSGNHLSPNTTVMVEVNHLKIHWPIAHIDRAIGWLRLLQS